MRLYVAGSDCGGLFKDWIDVDAVLPDRFVVERDLHILFEDLFLSYHYISIDGGNEYGFNTEEEKIEYFKEYKRWRPSGYDAGNYGVTIPVRNSRDEFVSLGKHWRYPNYEDDADGYYLRTLSKEEMNIIINGR